MSSTTTSESPENLPPPRPKQRSRSGCLTCRSRGYKCDEKKPICRACTRLRRTCQYATATKWINETVVNSGHAVVKQSGLPTRSDSANRLQCAEEAKDDGSSRAWQVQRWNSRSPGSDSSSYRQHSSNASSISEDMIPLSLSPHSLLPVDLRLLNHWSVHLAPALNFSATDSFCYFITPMALSPQHPPALYHSLLALSAAHLASHDPTLEIVALREQQRAIQLLKSMVEGNKVDEEALATVLMLRIFEDFTASPDSTAAMYHSRGASSIIRSGGIKSSKSPTVAFLLSIFSYYDVISAISLEQSTYLSPQEDIPTQTPQVDLFIYYTGPILHQLSEISSLVDLLKRTIDLKAPSTPTPPIILDRVKQIMHVLQVPIDVPCPSSAHLDYLFTAEAYRHASLVYLGKVLLNWHIPLSSSSIRTSASACLTALSSVPASAPVAVRHLYPLFTAACECFEEDREFARGRLEFLAGRGGGLPNVRRVLGLVERVWVQKDKLEGWKKVELGCFEVMKEAGKVVLIS